MHVVIISNCVEKVCSLFLGNTPGTFSIGAVFNHNCLFFETKCENEGVCLAQDLAATSLHLTMVIVGIKLFAQIFITIGYIIYKPPKKLPVCEIEINKDISPSLYDSSSISEKSDNTVKTITNEKDNFAFEDTDF